MVWGYPDTPHFDVAKGGVSGYGIGARPGWLEHGSMGDSSQWQCLSYTVHVQYMGLCLHQIHYQLNHTRPKRSTGKVASRFWRREQERELVWAFDKTFRRVWPHETVHMSTSVAHLGTRPFPHKLGGYMGRVIKLAGCNTSLC